MMMESNIKNKSLLYTHITDQNQIEFLNMIHKF